MKLRILKVALTAWIVSISCVVNLAQAGLIFNVTEYTENTMQFQVTGTLDQVYDSNHFDSMLFVATDYDLSPFWNTSSVSFSGTSLVNGVSSTWRRFDNGSDTGYAFYASAGGDFTSLLPINSTFDMQITATGTFDVINYSASDFGLYLGSESRSQDAQYLLASAFSNNTEVPEPSTLAIFALGIIGLVSRRLS